MLHLLLFLITTLSPPPVLCRPARPMPAPGALAPPVPSLVYQRHVRGLP